MLSLSPSSLAGGTAELSSWLLHPPTLTPRTSAGPGPPPHSLLSARLPASISAFVLFLHLVIGRGGEQINKIQQDSGCKVQISPGMGSQIWARTGAGLG